MSAITLVLINQKITNKHQNSKMKKKYILQMKSKTQIANPRK